MNKVKKNRTAKKSIIFVNQPYDISSGVNFKVNSFNNHAVMSASKHEIGYRIFPEVIAGALTIKKMGHLKVKGNHKRKKVLYLKLLILKEKKFLKIRIIW